MPPIFEVNLIVTNCRSFETAPMGCVSHCSHCLCMSLPLFRGALHGQQPLKPVAVGPTDADCTEQDCPVCCPMLCHRKLWLSHSIDWRKFNVAKASIWPQPHLGELTKCKCRSFGLPFIKIGRSKIVSGKVDWRSSIPIHHQSLLKLASRLLNRSLVLCYLVQYVQSMPYSNRGGKFIW